MQKLFDLALSGRPFLGQWPQDHRLDDHHDLFRVGVMRPDLPALVRIEEALEQRAEMVGSIWLQSRLPAACKSPMSPD